MKENLKHDEWGELIHSVSFKKSDIRWGIISSIALFVAFLLSLLVFVGRWIEGLIGILLFITIFILLGSLIRSHKDQYFKVYENGLWFPKPTYWLWQKRPPDERYFRSFDEIIDVEKEARGSYHLYIDTESEGKIHYSVYKKQGPELMDAIIEAMSEYEKGSD